MENNRKSSDAEIEKYNLEILLRRPSLRASISRRVSQIRQATVTTPDTTCGLGCIRGQWLQSFANGTTFIFAYEVLGSLYASYVAYFYGAITTLEKRFKFSSQTTGTIATSGDISKIITSLLLSLFPPKVHKPRCLGMGVFFIILSAVIFVTPHFLFGPRRESNGWRSNATQFRYENCTESYRTCGKETNDYAFFIFLLTQILHGIGGGLYQTQGKSYKDVNIHLHQSPSLMSLLSILKTLGPAFGYWLSSICLKTHVSLEKMTEDNDTQWIGAWWLGNLVIAFILFVVGFLLIFFPPTLPKAAVRRIFNNVRERADVKENSSSGGIHKTRTGEQAFDSFNSTYFFGTFNVVGFLAYFIFLPKYAEIQYQISASSANLIAGSVTLISAAFGIVMANSVITRYRPNARALAAWTIIVGVLSTGSLISYSYFGCTENDSKIQAVAYKFLEMNNSCECGFNPICPQSEITVPQCQIKCNEVSQKNVNKINKDCQQTLNNKSLITDFCPVDCYSNFLLFIIVTCSVTFFYATGQTSNFWLEVKCPNNICQPLGLHFLNILVAMPTPIIFGYILDNSCLLWDDNCTGTGNCWLYDNPALRYAMNFTSIGFATIGIIFKVGIWYSVKNLTLFYNDEEEYLGQNNEI